MPYAHDTASRRSPAGGGQASTTRSGHRSARRAIQGTRQMRNRLSWQGATRTLAVVASVGMFAVLVMGTVVTNTGPAQGCGRDWPLCRGKFIPEFAVKSFIEFSHRAVTGVEGMLMVALAVGALAFWRRRRETQ